MPETPYFFEVAGSARFAVVHQPEGTPKGGFLFVHPLFEDKLWAHRVYVNLARSMARSGYIVLRMDMRGSGDSEGDFAKAGVKEYLEDLCSGWSELKRHTCSAGQHGVFGLRLGGTLALAFAQGHDDVAAVLVWDPILDADRYLQDLLRMNLSSQLAAHGKVLFDRDTLIDRMHQGEAIDTDGYPLTATLFDSLVNLKLNEQGPGCAKHALLVQICRSGDQALREEYQKYTEIWDGMRLETAVEEPFWREIKTFYDNAPNLEAKSLAWLESIQ